MIKRYIWVFLYLLLVCTYPLSAQDFIEPLEVDPEEKYPLICIINKNIDKSLLKNHAQNDECYIHQTDQYYTDRNSINQIITQSFIDQNRISLITSGEKGFSFILHNPLLFASSIVYLNNEELKNIYNLLKTSSDLLDNLKKENIYFIISKSKTAVRKIKVLKLIEKKQYPIKILYHNEEDIFKLCDEKLNYDLDSLDFSTDNIDFNQCQWLTIFGTHRNSFSISGKLDDDILYINSYTVDSFEIDFSHPVFEDLDEMFKIKFNYSTTFYEKIPPAKKIYIINKVMITTNKDFLITALNKNIQRKDKEEDEIIKESKDENREETYKSKSIEEPEITEPVEKETVLNNKVESTTEPDQFIPGQEKVKLKFNNINKEEVEKWKVNINLPDKSLFKEITGENTFNNEILWDGRNDKAQPLPNGLDCFYNLEYSDKNQKQFKTKMFPLKTTLQVKKEKKKLTIEMHEILFKKNSARLSITAKDVLEKIYKLILDHKKDIKTIMIEGHTDDTGNKRFNQRLSEKRAQSVQKYLFKKQLLLKKRIIAKGYGDSQPAVPNTSEQNRKQNRRVKIMINLK